MRASTWVGLYTLTKRTSAKPPEGMKSPGVSSAPHHYMMGSACAAPVNGQVAALTEKYKVHNKRLPSYWIFKTCVNLVENRVGNGAGEGSWGPLLEELGFHREWVTLSSPAAPCVLHRPLARSWPFFWKGQREPPGVCELTDKDADPRPRFLMTAQSPEAGREPRQGHNPNPLPTSHTRTHWCRCPQTGQGLGAGAGSVNPVILQRRKPGPAKGTSPADADETYYLLPRGSGAQRRWRAPQGSP